MTPEVKTHEPPGIWTFLKCFGMVLALFSWAVTFFSLLGNFFLVFWLSIPTSLLGAALYIYLQATE